MEEMIVEQLKDLVKKHNVCWESIPLQASTEEGLHPIGYEIRLMGTHETHASSIRPGCELCIDVYKDLRQIAEVVLPPSDRASKYSLSGYDSALRYASNFYLPPTVQLKIEIHHRENWDDPIDECEDRCLKDITDTLKQLGVLHRRWPVR